MYIHMCINIHLYIYTTNLPFPALSIHIHIDPDNQKKKARRNPTRQGSELSSNNAHAITRRVPDIVAFDCISIHSRAVNSTLSQRQCTARNFSKVRLAYKFIPACLAFWEISSDKRIFLPSQSSCVMELLEKSALHMFKMVEHTLWEIALHKNTLLATESSQTSSTGSYLIKCLKSQHYMVMIVEHTFWEIALHKNMCLATESSQTSSTGSCRMEFLQSLLYIVHDGTAHFLEKSHMKKKNSQKNVV